MYSLIKKIKLASNTPKPPGAAGTTKPIDQDKQKTINNTRLFWKLFWLKILKQIKKLENFEQINNNSITKDFIGKKDCNLILE